MSCQRVQGEETRRDRRNDVVVPVKAPPQQPVQWLTVCVVASLSRLQLSVGVNPTPLRN